MHDRLDHGGMNEDAALAQALRALPPRAPAQDAWPQLATRIQRRRIVRRSVWFTLPAAFAAAIALTLAWPHVQPRPAPSTPARIAAQPPAKHSAVDATPDVAALRTRSQQWQAWVLALNHDGAPLDGRQLTQAVALQDRIGLVDLQLSATRNPATAADLWQQRITLLQQLGLLHLQPYLAASGPAANSDPRISK